MDFSQATLLFVVLAPGVVFATFALLWLLGWAPSERVVSRITGLTFSACIFGLAVIVWTLASTGAPSVTVTFGNWFAVHDYHFPLVLLADRLSLPFLGLTVVLSGLIGQFSATYLHRERGFLRFFLLLHLFAFGSLLAFAAGSFDLLVAGWEMVGITSVLLIAFFQQRAAPVENTGGPAASRTLNSRLEPMSQTVRGVISRKKGEPVELVDIVVPDPGPGEAVVDITACGVCHTDLTYREGGINDEYPFLLGHEAAGTVGRGWGRGSPRLSRATS